MYTLEIVKEFVIHALEYVNRKVYIALSSNKISVTGTILIPIMLSHNCTFFFYVLNKMKRLQTPVTKKKKNSTINSHILQDYKIVCIFSQVIFGRFESVVCFSYILNFC